MHKYHDNAKTNIHRRRIIKSDAATLTCREQAEIEHVSVATVHKWRHRPDDRLADASCRPRHVRYAFDESVERLVLHLRDEAGLPLDRLLEAVEGVVPSATRSSVHRLLKRHGKQRLPREPRPDHGRYDDEDRPPGFLHIDSFMLDCLSGERKSQAARRHCFVAIDRATRMVFLQVYGSCAGDAACDFLERCREFFPFRIRTVLTDNGAQYTLKATAPKKHEVGRRRPFEDLCGQHGIDHRTTRPYTPKTNGLVERVNGLVQAEALKRRRIETVQERDQALLAWLNNHNLARKNNRIPIGRMTPLEAAIRWHGKNPELYTRLPQRHTTSRQSCSEPSET